MHSLALTDVHTGTCAHVQESGPCYGTGAMILPKVSSLPGSFSYLHSFLFLLYNLLLVPCFCFVLVFCLGFFGGSDGKESAYNSGDPRSNPGLGRAQEDPLEKEMAAHSSIFARRIPRTKEAGGSQSMGSQRVRHV